MESEGALFITAISEERWRNRGRKGGLPETWEGVELSNTLTGIFQTDTIFPEMDGSFVFPFWSTSLMKALRMQKLMNLGIQTLLGTYCLPNSQMDDPRERPTFYFLGFRVVFWSIVRASVILSRIKKPSLWNKKKPR